MIHGINNDFLYAVTRLEVKFSDYNDREISISGTGFWVSKGSKPFLITNRHVLDPGFSDPEFAPFSKIVSIQFDTRSYNDIDNKVVVGQYTMESYHIDYADNNIDDIACISGVKAINCPIISSFIPYTMIADSNQFFNELSVCDQIAFIGFPIVFDHKHIMPVLRSGVISSDPRLDYSYDGKEHGHCLAYEAFSTGGSSGSPVFVTQKGFKLGIGLKGPEGFYRPSMLIGINAGYIWQGEAKVHQYMSYMYKSDQIKSLILEAESKL